MSTVSPTIYLHGKDRWNFTFNVYGAKPFAYSDITTSPSKERNSARTVQKTAKWRSILFFRQHQCAVTFGTDVLKQILPELKTSENKDREYCIFWGLKSQFHEPRGRHCTYVLFLGAASRLRVAHSILEKEVYTGVCVTINIQLCYVRENELWYLLLRPISVAFCWSLSADCWDP
jgi:hypothetical protein